MATRSRPLYSRSCRFSGSVVCFVIFQCCILHCSWQVSTSTKHPAELAHSLRGASALQPAILQHVASLIPPCSPVSGLPGPGSGDPLETKEGWKNCAEMRVDDVWTGPKVFEACRADDLRRCTLQRLK